jgi:hypothetical protein
MWSRRALFPSRMRIPGTASRDALDVAVPLQGLAENAIE